MFGDANISSNINNKTIYLLYNNQFLDFNSKYVLGKFRVKQNYQIIHMDMKTYRIIQLELQRIS